jgi:hypothetical protein
MPGTVTAIWGPEKTNKSGLALTWPTPIRHYDFDMGFARASWLGDYTKIDEMLDKGELTTMELPTPVNISIQNNTPLTGYRERWISFIQDYLQHLEAGDVETYIIDTGTQAWSICHHAYLQELQEKQLPLSGNDKLRAKLIPIEYGEPNNRMQSVEQAAKSRGKNLVICHHQTDVYSQRMGPQGMEEYKTGEFDLDGFRRTKNLSDMVIRTRMTRAEGVWLPEAEITLCGLSMNMVGMKFQNPTYEKFTEALARLRS